MQIEEGKYYIAVDGRVFGPMKSYWFGHGLGGGFHEVTKGQASGRDICRGSWKLDGTPLNTFWPKLVEEVAMPDGGLEDAQQRPRVLIAEGALAPEAFGRIKASLEASKWQGLTTEEADVVNALAHAWNLFMTLPDEHPDDETEFRTAIHAAQNMILGRTGRRQINAMAARK